MRASAAGARRARGGSRGAAALLATAVLATALPARAWDPFTRRNPAVERGNEAMRSGAPDRALEAYEEAARSLPGEPGVHLNRGLALLAQDDLAGARDALRIAASPDTPAELRADALYDLGLAFLREAEARASEEDHAEAQKLFREAADAFRGSLRARPGDRDTAWNLELALRRLQEEREKQEAREREEQERREEEEEQQEQEQPEEEGAEEPEDETAPDGPEDDEPPPGDPQGDEAPQDGAGEPEPQGDEPQAEQQPPEASEGDDRGGDEGTPPRDAEAGREDGERRLPRDVARVLDALREDEQSLEAERAAERGRRERRTPSKDW